MNHNERKAWEKAFQQKFDAAERRRSLRRNLTTALVVTVCLMAIPLMLKSK